MDLFKLKGRLQIAQIMGVSPLRIQNLHLDIDFVNIFLHATLLDRSPATGNTRLFLPNINCQNQ